MILGAAGKAAPPEHNQEGGFLVAAVDNIKLAIDDFADSACSFGAIR